MTGTSQSNSNRFRACLHLAGGLSRGAMLGSAVLLLSLSLPARVLAAPQSTCNANMSWNAGNYRVFTNYWNQAACPGTQCVTLDDATGNFGVTSMTANCSQVA